MMNEFKRLFYSILTLVIVFSFQNCGLQSRVNQTLSSLKQESGNGGGYEGKPDGIFYRYIPNYMCEGSYAAEQVTEIRNGKAFLYDNKKNQCGTSEQAVPVSSLDISPFQKEFISVGDYLFKRYDEKPVGIPNVLAEVLCRDDFANPKFEIISHYDREKNEAFSRVYFKDMQIPDFPVSRLLSVNDVKYVSSEISFSLDFSKPIQDFKKFGGAIQKSSVPGIAAGPLVCVIGGSLDSSNWTLKTISDLDAKTFQVIKNGEVLIFSDISRNYYYQMFYTFVAHIFKVSFDGVVSDFSKLILGNEFSVVYTGSSNSNDLITFTGIKPTEGWPSLYVFDTRNSKVKRLTNNTPNGVQEAYSYMDPTLTKDQYLIYDTEVFKNYFPETRMVRVYDITTDSIQDVFEIDELRYGYGVIPETNQVYKFGKDFTSHINYMQVYDAKTKTTRKMVLTVPTNCFISTEEAVAIENNSEVLVTQNCDNTSLTANSTGVRVSLATGSIIKLSDQNSRIKWVSPNKKWVLISDFNSTNSLYNVLTKKTTMIPIDPDFGYGSGIKEEINNFLESKNRMKVALINDQYLYGLGGSIDSPDMYQVDVTSGDSNQVCKEAQGKKLFIGTIADKKVFLFTYDKTLKVFRFYQAKSPTDCPRINEFPSDSSSVPKLIPTEIGFGLLMSDPVAIQKGIFSSAAVFVPIDGRPPVKFNTDTNNRWDMDIAPTKNRIYLLGPGSNDKSNIFSFDIK